MSGTSASSVPSCRYDQDFLILNDKSGYLIHRYSFQDIGCLLIVDFLSEDPFAALDLGAGTGLLTSLILNKFPKAKLTVLDISEEMLAKARERFKGNRQVRFSAVDCYYKYYNFAVYAGRKIRGFSNGC